MRLLMLMAIFLAGAGCATAPAPVGTLSAQQVWRDGEFQPVAVTTDASSLFALPPDLLALLGTSGIRQKGTQQRVDFLINLLFGAERHSFRYVAGHSTIAAETWRLKRGDCLSLSVLAYSIGRALNLRVRLQEVPVAQFYDRRGNVDFIGRHVNVMVLNETHVYLKNGNLAVGKVVIDFDPEVGQGRAGIALTAESVLARFYANIGAEYFARDERDAAYAWFKAAVRADPAYAPGYSNLAQLYKRKGLLDGAETLLAHAVALDAADDTPVRALHALLQSQGRDAEAQKYADLLQTRRERNPYYWLEQGREYLQLANYDRAVDALERAQALSIGFGELHQYLAVAYWRSGDTVKAHQQLAILKSLHPSGAGQVGAPDAAVAALSRKFAKTAQQSP